MDVFISDCHIGASFAKCDLLRSFVDANRRIIKTLHLVGDIFDFWKKIPDDGDLSIFDKISNIKYYPGNHDAEMIAAKLFTRNVVYNAIYRRNKNNIFVSHGNEFDSKYGFRSLFDFIADKLIYFVSKKLGFYIRSKLRFLSDFYYLKSSYFDNVKAFLEKNSCKYYIYGHTHMPGIIQNGDLTLINLGSWYDKPMALFCDGAKYAFIEVAPDHLSPSEEDFNNSW